MTPDEFADYASMARAKGFQMVSATPLTRSSYHADSDFAALRAARQALAEHGSANSVPTHAEHKLVPYTAGADVRPGRRCRQATTTSCPGAPASKVKTRTETGS